MNTIVYVVLYGIGWPEDGDSVAGVYSSEEKAEAAASKDKRAFAVIDIELDAEPVYSEP